MKANGFINRYRRRVMHSLTGGIGNNLGNCGLNRDEIRRVLVSRPNSRLGNQLLLTPLVQELQEIFPNCEIDLFVRGKLAPIIFKNYPRVNFIMLPSKPFDHLLDYLHVWINLIGKHYDLAVNAVESSSSGRLSIRLSKAKYKLYDLSDDELAAKYDDYIHVAKHPIYNIRKTLGVNEGKPIPTLDIKIDSHEKEEGLELLDSLVDASKKTVCIFTYATGDKCLSREWWSQLHKEWKAQFGKEYNILEILPKENISNVGHKVPSLYSNDIREMAAVMSSTALFIGADSGVMHLAAASGIPTIGLFSITYSSHYGPYGNQSMSLEIDGKSTDEVFAAIKRFF
jgi:heptosyltransferase-3